MGAVELVNRMDMEESAEEKYKEVNGFCCYKSLMTRDCKSNKYTIYRIFFATTNMVQVRIGTESVVGTAAGQILTQNEFCGNNQEYVSQRYFYVCPSIIMGR